MKINYEVGDCLTFPTDQNKVFVVPHVCNDAGGWGSGFVVAISNAYETPEAKYRNWAKTGKYYQFGKEISFELGETQFVKVENDVIIANMIAQHSTIKHNPKPIRYRHLARTMGTVGKICKEYQNKLNINAWSDGNTDSEIKVVIRCPMFGSGLAGGDWKFIEELINEIWICDYELEVTVCALTERDLP